MQWTLDDLVRVKKEVPIKFYILSAGRTHAELITGMATSIHPRGDYVKLCLCPWVSYIPTGDCAHTIIDRKWRKSLYVTASDIIVDDVLSHAVSFIQKYRRLPGKRQHLLEYLVAAQRLL